MHNHTPDMIPLLSGAPCRNKWSTLCVLRNQSTHGASPCRAGTVDAAKTNCQALLRALSRDSRQCARAGSLKGERAARVNDVIQAPPFQISCVHTLAARCAQRCANHIGTLRRVTVPRQMCRFACVARLVHGTPIARVPARGCQVETTPGNGLIEMHSSVSNIISARRKRPNTRWRVYWRVPNTTCVTRKCWR